MDDLSLIKSSSAAAATLPQTVPVMPITPVTGGRRDLHLDEVTHDQISRTIIRGRDIRGGAEGHLSGPTTCHAITATSGSGSEMELLLMVH